MKFLKAYTRFYNTRFYNAKTYAPACIKPLSLFYQRVCPARIESKRDCALDSHNAPNPHKRGA